MQVQKERIILLVEDNADDEELALLAFRLNQTPVKVLVVRDGVEALDYLGTMETDKARPRPSMILLDLKLPRVDGLEVLRRIRSDGRTRGIPVVVLTSSTEDVDYRRSAELGADEYVRKPMSFDEFRKTTRKLADTWLRPDRETDVAG
jgi:two-component system response regulator